MSGWPALILTAGLGTRLRPLSTVRAKAAMPVAGVPLIHRLFAWITQYGVHDVVLNLHHRADTLSGIVGDGSDVGLRVRYSWENPMLGSAGGPRRALPLLDADRFFILNGDTLTDLDLAALARAHVESGALATLAVVPNPDPRRYGALDVDSNGHVVGVTRSGPDNRGLHFIGAQAVDASAFRTLAPDTPAESVGQLYPEWHRSRPGSVRAYVSGASFREIGTVASYVATSREIARLERDGAPPAGRNPRVAAGARVTGSILWDDVTVEADCDLVDCVLTDRVTVPTGSSFTRSSIVRAEGRAPGPGEELVGDLIIAPITT